MRMPRLGRRSYWQHVPKGATGFNEPFYPIKNRWPKECTNPKDCVSVIESNHKVFLQGAAATPEVLLRAMCEHAHEQELENVEVIHLHTHTEGDTRGVPAPQVSADFGKHFDDNSLFIGSNVRKAVNSPDSTADFTPIFLSDIPQLFETSTSRKSMSDRGGLDVALLHVSPPDAHGFCSLGTSVDCSRSAVLSATYSIAQVNPQVPRSSLSLFLSDFPFGL